MRRTGTGPDEDEQAGHVGPGPDLSVVIPTHRQAHCLEPVLESLARQTLPRELFEVVVVEDPSEMSYESAAGRARELGFRFTTLPHRAGRSVTRNHAVNLARGRLLLFLDGDCYAAPDLLERHWRCHRDAPGPRVAAGTRLELTSLEFTGRLLRGEAISQGERDEHCYDIRFPPGLSAEVVRLAMATPWLYTYTNISAPSALVAEVGGFDEKLGLEWGLEDIDLFYRLFVHMGRPVDAFHYDESMVAYHMPHFRNRDLEFGQFRGNESYFRRKHAHFEVEFSVDRPDLAAHQIRLYRQRLAQFTASQAGRTDLALWRHLEEALSAWAAPQVLYAGLGTATLPLPAGTVTVDHGAPPSESNEHLLVLWTGYPEKAFDLVVNVDLWRLLEWQDLCVHVSEALRIADEFVLVRTPVDIAGDLVGDDRDVDYLLRALGAHFAITWERTETGALLVRARTD